MDKILAEYTEFALEFLRKGDPDFQWGPEQRPPFVVSDLIILPPFNDGHMSVGCAVIKYHSDPLWFTVVDGAGNSARFTDQCQAFTYSMEC